LEYLLDTLDHHSVSDVGLDKGLVSVYFSRHTDVKKTDAYEFDTRRVNSGNLIIQKNNIRNINIRQGGMFLWDRFKSASVAQIKIENDTALLHGLYCHLPAQSRKNIPDQLRDRQDHSLLSGSLKGPLKIQLYTKLILTKYMKILQYFMLNTIKLNIILN
jgi:hypothetical protein